MNVVEANAAADADAVTTRLIGAGLLVAALGGLFFYKWTGSFRTVDAVHLTGVLRKSPDVLMVGGALSATLRYLALVWPALAFGVLIGAVAQAALPPRWIDRVLGREGPRSIIAGGLVGVPLMLCACCVSPVGASLYSRGARLGPALAVAMGSPGLNVAALLLTFMILPLNVALPRLVSAVVMVFGLSALIGRLFAGVALTAPAPARAGEPPRTLGELARRFARTITVMTVVTVPVVFFGVLASSWILPYTTSLSGSGTLITILVVAAVATLVALPTFFEIPIALLLASAGAPTGALVAFVIAGPIINLPSLVILGWQTGPRAAVTLAVGVWLVASAAGIIVSF